MNFTTIQHLRSGDIYKLAGDATGQMYRAVGGHYNAQPVDITGDRIVERRDTAYARHLPEWRVIVQTVFPWTFAKLTPDNFRGLCGIPAQ